MTADFLVVLDACVIVPAALRDTLLRLAEKRLFLPRWTDEIIQEMVRTLQQKLKKTEEQTTHLTSQLKIHFGDAWVSSYGPILSVCRNDLKDRHVLAAAAIKANAGLIVTFNTKHFPKPIVAPWGIEISQPDGFLIDLFHLDPKTVIHTLHEQAEDINSNTEKLLSILKAGVPKFVELISPVLRPASTETITIEHGHSVVEKPGA